MTVSSPDQGQRPEFLERPAVDGRSAYRLAYHKITAAPVMSGQPGLVFLGGLRSDMTGTKAVFLEAFCREAGLGFIRFDYFGHGASDGAFADGTISQWADDACAVIDQLTEGPQILVGSSLGGWLMVLTALKRRARIAGLIGIASAPDFTEDLMWARFTEAQRAEIEREGYLEQPSDYDPEPYRITRALIEDGRRNLVLRAPIDLAVPVHLLHGTADPDVPWQVILRLMERLESTDVRVELMKGGDHRLSDGSALGALAAAVRRLHPAFSP